MKCRSKARLFEARIMAWWWSIGLAERTNTETPGSHIRVRRPKTRGYSDAAVVFWGLRGSEGPMKPGDG